MEENNFGRCVLMYVFSKNTISIHGKTYAHRKYNVFVQFELDRNDGAPCTKLLFYSDSKRMNAFIDMEIEIWALKRV